MFLQGAWGLSFSWRDFKSENNSNINQAKYNHNFTLVFIKLENKYEWRSNAIVFIQQ